MNRKTFYLAVLLLTLVIYPASSALANEACAPQAATVQSIQGQVEVKRTESSQWHNATLNQALCNGDSLKIHQHSRAVIYLQNDTVLRLDENTEIVISEIHTEESSWLDLLQGIVHFISRTKKSLTIKTPYANAAIEGTEFVVEVTDNNTEVIVFEGRVVTKNELGEVVLTDNQAASAQEGSAPREVIMLNPRDAVQWALYFPPLLKADISGNQLQQASSLLNEGQVEQAKEIIEQVLTKEPENGEAKALMAIISIVNNDKDTALKLANEAVEATPDSAASHIALSYAWQAQFNLEQAIISASTAVKKEPNNSLAWARLAELQLSIGQLDDALDSAQKANELDSNNAQSKTILGFAYLIQIKIEKARETFKQAITLDQTDPLPRLGLGLAKIRDNELQAGRQEIEIAASLDPNNSLIRSYLGKAYYEEKRSPLDAVEFEIAKRLDPKDPTPWFYDAIRKQTENDPVGALRDLNKSIELNDNRVVYRSKLQLDEDQAARSASQARIYKDLGFEQLARIESTRSLMLDPTNGAAHRQLADSYVGNARNEIARVSELLQAQMLQPINNVPVQPSSSETNLYSFEGAGPTSASFNEFNSLFNRKRFVFQSNGILGGDKTRGGEIFAASLMKRGTVSVGHFEHRSDGFRENNDSDKKITNLFAHFRLTPALSIQGEYREKTQEIGDLELRFNSDTFNRNSRRTVDENNARLGLHYKTQPGNIILLAMNRGRLKDETKPNSFISNTTENHGTQYEAQYHWQSKRWLGVGGLGYLYSDDMLTQLTDVPFAPHIPPTDRDIEQVNAYSYNTFTSRHFTFLIGAGYDRVEQNAGIEQERINPKLGISWSIHPRILFRAAAFRTLKRRYVQNQTLEPSQIAGFNQLVADQLGTSAWLYAIGMDYTPKTDMKFGIELSEREINRIFVTSSKNTRGEEQEEFLHRAYLSLALRQNAALNIEYLYEDFDRDFISGTASKRPASLTTHQLPFGMYFFHNNGVYTRLQTTFVKQEILLILDGDGTERLQDKFLISDVALGYRLPKRRGLIEVVAKNLANEKFSYYSVNPGPGTPLISPFYPDTTFFMSIQLWM